MIIRTWKYIALTLALLLLVIGLFDQRTRAQGQQSA